MLKVVVVEPLWWPGINPSVVSVNHFWPFNLHLSCDDLSPLLAAQVNSHSQITFLCVCVFVCVCMPAATHSPLPEPSGGRGWTGDMEKKGSGLKMR